MSTQQLEALAIQAQGLDAETAETDPGAIIAQQEEAAQIDLAGQNSGQVYMIIDLAMPMLGTLYPSLEEVYTDEAKKAVSGALGPLLAKYGISISDIGGKWKEEIAAAMICGPIAIATARAVKTDIEARAKKKPVDANAKEAPKAAQAERVLPIDPPMELG